MTYWHDNANRIADLQQQIEGLTKELAEALARLRELDKGESREWVRSTLLDDLQGRVQVLTEALTRIRNGGYHGASYIAGEALKSTET